MSGVWNAPGYVYWCSFRVDKSSPPSYLVFHFEFILSASKLMKYFAFLYRWYPGGLQKTSSFGHGLSWHWTLLTAWVRNGRYTRLTWAWGCNSSKSGYTNLVQAKHTWQQHVTSLPEGSYCPIPHHVRAGHSGQCIFLCYLFLTENSISKRDDMAAHVKTYKFPKIDLIVIDLKTTI